VSQQKIAYLETMDLFQDLTAQELDAVGHSTHLMTYPTEHIFFMPDQNAEVLFILKKGRVQLYRISPDGRKLVVDVLYPGAIFGHMALVGQGMHHTYAQALDDCVICIWNRGEVEALLLSKPQVALRFLGVIGERLYQTQQRLTETTFKRIPARMASLLLRLDQQTGRTGQLRGYTHQYLADMLGTYRETATQVLNDFKNDKLIKLGRKKLDIVDRPRLQEIAAQD
jgi:CRP/FNR family transcriptional regulator, cyclic AMP receptor protein